jgi:radical SAM protein with 4Fe4S-binding SPASM domain
MAEDGWKYDEMHMELTTACNFRCGFCPSVELQRPQSRLDFELIQGILNDCRNHRLTKRVAFHLLGEALLYPQCMEVLELCRRLEMHTRLVTNGSLYNEEKYRQLYELIDILDISCRTADDMELQAVQKPLTFEQYLEMVVAAVKLRAALPSSRTRVRIRLFISTKTWPTLKTLCGRLDVAPAFLLNADQGKIQPNQEFRPKPWLSILCEQEQDWRYIENVYPSRFGNCDEYENSFSILSDGAVTSCCWDAHGENAMGNLRHSTLPEILENEASRRFRAAFRRHICPTEKCRKCTARPTWVRSVVYQALSLLNLR